MRGMSDKCGRENCRFCEAGECTDQEQRRECLELINQIIPDSGDRLTLSLSGQEIYKALICPSISARKEL